MENLSLESIKELLDEELLDSQIVEADEEVNRFLSVFVGEDHKNRGYWLNIRLAPQMISDGIAEIEEGYLKASYFSLTYSLEFPFPVKTYAVANAARLVAFLNHSIHLPGFELNEVEEKVSFRYVTMVRKEGVSKQNVMAILGSIFLFKDMYSETLEKVCSGSMSMNEVLEEIAAVFDEVVS